MGLDVSLYKYEDYEKSMKLEREYEKKSEKIWKEVGKGKRYGEMTEKEKEKAHKQTRKLAENMGLIYGEADCGEENIKIDSKKYPNHLFKIGYFRSSYNDGGLNSVLRRTIDLDLYYIFDVGGDYEPSNDWEANKKRAKEVIRKFKKYIKEHGDYDVMDIDIMNYSKNPPRNKKEALEKFFEELESHKDSKSFRSYSSGRGDFYLDGIKVFGFITGKSSLWKSKYIMYVIYENKDRFKWYLEALEIVLETINWILKQKEPEKYRLSWSA